MQIEPPVPQTSVPGGGPRRSRDEIAAAARDFEAAFLSQSLRMMGYGAPRDAFGGGLGEEQLTSWLCDAQARAITERGGIGLAERLIVSGVLEGAKDE